MGYLKDELSGFVETELAKEIIKEVTRGSATLQLGKLVPMKGEKKKVPVLTDGPGAYWTGEGVRITTSTATWIFPELVAKKIAVIIPVTKEKLEDSVIDVFEELKEPIAEAMYKTLDSAAFFGTNSPFSQSIYWEAVDEGNVIGVGGTNGTDKYDIDVSNVMAKVEEKTDVTGFAAKIGVKNTIRKLRDTNGAALYVADDKTFYSEPISFVRNGAWDNSKADLIAGNFDKLLVGIRDGIQYEILKEATLQNTLDSDNKPISLAEQDMIGIKATFRVGFLVLTGKAFAVLEPASARSLTVTSEAGTTTGDTKLTVSQTLQTDHTWAYKTASSVTDPKIGKTVTGYTAWDGDDDITATTGNKIMLVELDGKSKVTRFGSATVTSKA